MTPANPSSWQLLEAVRGDVATNSTVADVVAPTAFLLALRWADEQDAEQAAVAEFNGEEVKRVLPEALSWRRWRAAPRPLSSEEVGAVWSAIRRILGLPPDSLNTHDRVRLPTGRLLHAIVAWLDQITLDTAKARRRAGDAFTELVLQTMMGIARFGGELVTPQPMARLMVALAGPQPSERIYDPCFGTGGLLVDAAETLWRRGLDIAPGEWARAQRVPIFGVERNADLHLVAFVRLLLAGVRPALEVGDALEREAAGRHHDQGFDCVLADAPWGMKVEGSHLYDFPIRGKSSENLFLQHAVRSLRPGGRAVVAIPPGLLFRGGSDYEVRRWLLQECRVDLVARLPAKTLSYTAIQPCLLVLRRAPPADVVRFVDVSSLPESPQAIRGLATSLLASEELSPHRVRAVPVVELLKADARLVVSEAIEPVADDRLEFLDAAFEQTPLGDVATVVAGVSVRRNAVVEHGEAGAVPLIRVGDMSEGVLRLGARYLQEAARAAVHDEQLVRPGDVLVSIDGTIGKVLYVQNPQSARRPGATDQQVAVGVAQKGLVIIRPREMLDARFLAAILASTRFQRLLRGLATGEYIAHLPMKALRGLCVPVPPPAVQENVLRRLADRPGDAIDALLAALAGHDEDPLARLFRENVAVGRLTGEGLPEPGELHQLGFDAFAALRPLRNQAAHAAVDLGPHATRWLLTIGAAPVVSGRRRLEGPDFESLDATKTMLERALESARDVGGTTGKQAIRLTERLLLWVDGARSRSAGDFRLAVEHEFEERLAGGGSVLVTVTLSGTVPLREFVSRLDIVQSVGRVEELLPGESTTLRCDLGEGLAWRTTNDSLVLPCRLMWSARRVDGTSVDGAEALLLRRILPRADDAAEAPELGVSPYITGDVVESAQMFVGRTSILSDIRTHLGGGTKVILLEGNRRTGKTSILRQLQRPEMGLLDSWVPVECSFQGTVGDVAKDGIPTEGVFRLIVRDIGLACAKAGTSVPLPEMEPTKDVNAFRFGFARALNGFFKGIDPYEALQIYVDMATAAIAPRRLLLMLDEFDKLQVGIDNGVTSPQVPENIRNLLQIRPGLSAILTGSRRLKRLREEYWSALFGFGHRIGVDPLEPAEVAQLVTQPVAGRLEFDSASVSLIESLTARQPYLVQSLCARIFELAKRNGWRHIRREDVQQAVGRTVRDNEHFQALWSYAETDRRRYLLCLCSRLAEGPQRVNAALLNEHLSEAGITVPIDSVDEDLKFLVELELVVMGNTAVGPQYELALPLMRRWMDLNIDAEAQRRKAIHEQQFGASLFPEGAFALRNGLSNGINIAVEVGERTTSDSPNDETHEGAAAPGERKRTS